VSLHFSLQAGQLVITRCQIDQEPVLFLKPFLFGFAGPFVLKKTLICTIHEEVDGNGLFSVLVNFTQQVHSKYVDDPVNKTLFLDTPYRHPLKMPIERIDFIDSCLFHNDQGKGIIDTDSIFLCPLDTVTVIVC
jgi:hypothetical protein